MQDLTRNWNPQMREMGQGSHNKPKRRSRGLSYDDYEWSIIMRQSKLHNMSASNYLLSLCQLECDGVITFDQYQNALLTNI
jgi:hypothetical protein